MYPPPVYINPEKAVLSDDERRITAPVLFPSSDPTVAVRGHANHAHFQFAVWNAAHLLIEKGLHGVTRPLAVRSSAEVHKMVLPDQELRMEWELLRLPQGKKKGLVSAEFYLGDTLCAEVLATFIDKP